MGRKYWIYALALACLVGCAGSLRGPETPQLYRNLDATQRVDIATGGHGSAVVLTEDGFLLTCFHVAGKGDRVLLVNIAEGDKPAVAYTARVVATDEKHDLAVIWIHHHFDRTAVVGDISEAHALDEVYNIGYPYALGRMAGQGAIKAVGWSYDDPDQPELKVSNGLALDIPNGPGTSGSGIYLAHDGKLIGLMQMVLTFGPRNAAGEPISDGRQVTVHVAIPVDVIRAFLDRAHIRYRTEFPG